MKMKVLTLLVLCVAACALHAAAKAPAAGKESTAAKAPVAAKTNSFQVGSYGARADGKTDDTAAFLKAWEAACSASGKVKLEVPAGEYLLGPISFSGPCPNVTELTFIQKGVIKATTDLSKYKSDVWVEFIGVNGLRMVDGGTFDGQGELAWKHNSCQKEKMCKALPVSVKFLHMNDTIVRRIKSINPKFFHMAVIDCHKFEANNLTLEAPDESPNTDGLHLERSTDVKILDAIIATGDDCISIGHGNSDVVISRVKCGPGHGLSIGSLGKYDYEEDVKGLIIRDSSINGTSNGVRIKTWEDSPVSTIAANISFLNIQMTNVTNPIIIDQTYCPFASCNSKAPSKVKLSNIYFKGIKGTSASPVAVTLECSKGYPCRNVNLQDVQLKHIDGSTNVTAVCENVSPRFSGTMLPSGCSAPTKSTS